jgi:pilus assembly protein Flp/PilA
MGRRTHLERTRIAETEGIHRFKGGSMLSLFTQISRKLREEDGASMVEYALLVVLIAIIALIAVSLAGQNVSKAFSTVASSLAATN